MLCSLTHNIHKHLPRGRGVVTFCSSFDLLSASSRPLHDTHTSHLTRTRPCYPSTARRLLHPTSWLTSHPIAALTGSGGWWWSRREQVWHLVSSSSWTNITSSQCCKLAPRYVAPRGRYDSRARSRALLVSGEGPAGCAHRTRALLTLQYPSRHGEVSLSAQARRCVELLFGFPSRVPPSRLLSSSCSWAWCCLSLRWSIGS